MQNSTLQTKSSPKIGNHWKKDGEDYIATLGSLKRAIVIRLFLKNMGHRTNHYGIAIASMLPFTEEQYQKRFNNAEDCIEYAEAIVKEWVQSLFVAQNTLQD